MPLRGEGGKALKGAGLCACMHEERKVVQSAPGAGARTWFPAAQGQHFVCVVFERPLLPAGVCTTTREAQAPP